MFANNKAQKNGLGHSLYKHGRTNQYGDTELLSDICPPGTWQDNGTNNAPSNPYFIDQDFTGWTIIPLKPCTSMQRIVLIVSRRKSMLKSIEYYRTRGAPLLKKNKLDSCRLPTDA